MKKTLLSILILMSMAGMAQTTGGVFNASKAQAFNKAAAANGAHPLDYKAMYHDTIHFVDRPFTSAAEANSFLPSVQRVVGLMVIVNFGGSVNGSTGVLTGGTNAWYYYKDGIGDGNLTLLFPSWGMQQVLTANDSITTASQNIHFATGSDLIFSLPHNFDIRYTSRTKIFSNSGQQTVIFGPSTVDFTLIDSFTINNPSPTTSKLSVLPYSYFYKPIRIGDTLKLPNLIVKTDSTANKPLAVDASGNTVRLDHWPIGAGGGGSPGGVSQSVQYNSSGFGGDSHLLYDATGHVFSSDTTTSLRLLLNPPSASPGRLIVIGNSITAAYQLPDTTYGYPMLTAIRMNLIPYFLGVSSSTLSKRSPVDPFGAVNFLDRTSTIPTFTAADRGIIEGGLNDVRYNGANYTNANFATDYQTLINAFFAKGATGSQLALMTPPYVPPTSYVSLGGNPAATQARHLAFCRTVDSLAAVNGCRVIEAYAIMQSHGAEAMLQPDLVHPGIDGAQLIADLCVAAFDGPVQRGTNAAQINGTIEASKLILRSLPIDTAAIDSKSYDRPLIIGRDGVVKLGTQRFIMSNFGNLPDYSSFFVSGTGKIGPADTSAPQRLVVGGGIGADFYTMSGSGVPDLSLLHHGPGFEIFTNGSSHTYFQASSRLSTFLAYDYSIQNSGGATIVGSASRPSANGELFQVAVPSYFSDYIKTATDVIAAGYGHIGSGSIASDFGSGGNSGAIDLYTSNGFFTGNGAFLAIAGNATKASFLSFIEKSIAAKWSIGTKGGDHLFYFTYGSSDGTLGRVKFTVDSLNGKIVWPNRPVLSVADSNAATPKHYVDSIVLANTSAGQPFSDASALVKNSSDATKLVKLSAASITTGTTRTWTFPDVSGTFARIDAAQTFTGIQTFNSSPKINAVPLGDTSLLVLAHGRDSSVMQIDIRPLIRKVIFDNADSSFIKTLATSDGSATTIDTIPLQPNKMATIDVIVIGHAQAGNDMVKYHREVNLQYDGATYTVLDASTIATDFEALALSTCSISVTVVGGFAVIKVTGVAATDINWKSKWTIQLQDDLTAL